MTPPPKGVSHEIRGKVPTHKYLNLKQIRTFIYLYSTVGTYTLHMVGVQVILVKI